MNRRAFFGVTIGAMAAAVMPWRRRSTPTVGAIDRATFKFWRDQRFDELTFKGAKFVFDEHVPSNRITFTHQEALRNLFHSAERQ